MMRWSKAALWMGLILSSSSIFASTSLPTSVEYNIARGLAPEISAQKVEVLQDFYGDFRILSTKRYVHDEQAKFSPIDYAVSWGLFADPKIASNIRVKQFDRFLKWSLPVLPVPPEQAMQMVSNMHIIPASPELAREIERVSRGDLVRLKGELVEIQYKDLVWRSSLTPTDTGEGACEVFRVHSIEWLEREALASSST